MESYRRRDRTLRSTRSRDFRAEDYLSRAIPYDINLPREERGPSATGFYGIDAPTAHREERRPRVKLKKQRDEKRRERKKRWKQSVWRRMQEERVRGESNTYRESGVARVQRIFFNLDR